MRIARGSIPPSEFAKVELRPPRVTQAVVPPKAPQILAPSQVCDLASMCPTCTTMMVPEHAHYRCPTCGYRDSCCS